VLSLGIQGLELDDPEGAPTVRVGEIFVNFQLSSLFHLTWTFDKFRVSSTELFIDRSKSGDLNIEYLTTTTKKSARK
jgi:hypothetical protein